MEFGYFDEIDEAQCQIIVNMRYIELSDISLSNDISKKKVGIFGGATVLRGAN